MPETDFLGLVDDKQPESVDPFNLVNDITPELSTTDITNKVWQNTTLEEQVKINNAQQIADAHKISFDAAFDSEPQFMAEVSKVNRYLLNPAATAWESIKQGYGGIVQSVGESMADKRSPAQQIADELGFELPKDMPELKKSMTPEFMTRFGERVATKGREITLKTQKNIESMSPKEDAPYIEKLGFMVIHNLGVNAPGLVAAIITKRPMAALSFLGGVSYGNKYTEERKTGATPDEAHTRALAVAGSEVGTEFLPISILLKPGLSIGKRIVQNLFSELVGENINTAYEMMQDKAIHDPDKPFGDFVVQDLLPAFRDTTLVAGISSLAMSGAVHPFVNGIDKTSEEATKKVLDEIASTPEGEKEIKDSVEKFKEQAQNITGKAEVDLITEGIKPPFEVTPKAEDITEADIMEFVDTEMEQFDIQELTPEEQIQRTEALNEDIVRKEFPPVEVPNIPFEDMTPEEQSAKLSQDVRRQVLGEEQLQKAPTAIVSKEISKPFEFRDIETGKPIETFYIKGGFGKSLVPVSYTGNLYHAATPEGVADLIQNYNPEEPVSFSTDRAKRHFESFEGGGRGMLLVFKVENKTGLYSPVDADAGKQFGWDEFRSKYNNWDELEKNLQEIRITKKAYDKLEASGDSDDTWLYDNIFQPYIDFFKIVDIVPPKIPPTIPPSILPSEEGKGGEKFKGFKVVTPETEGVKNIKQRIIQTTGQVTLANMIREDKALEAAFKKSQRAAREAYHAGNMAGVEAEKVKMREMLNQAKKEKGVVPPKPPTIPPGVPPPEGEGPEGEGEDVNLVEHLLARKKSSIGKDFLKGADKMIGIISTRLKNIHPEIKDALRRYVYKTNKHIAIDNESAYGFVSKFSKLEDSVKIELSRALLNSQKETADTIAKQHGMLEETNQARQIFEDTRDRALAAGLDVGKIENYWARSIKDIEGLLNDLRKTEEYSAIDEVFRKEEKKKNNPLTDEEKAILINQMLRGVPKDRISLTSTSYLKERKFKEIPNKYLKYYLPADQSLLSYIHGMNNAIEIARLFGKGKGEKAKSNFNPEIITEDALAKSIGDYVNELKKKGQLKGSDEQPLRDMLQAIIRPTRISEIVSLYKNLTYLQLLTQITPAITQIGDLALAAEEAGYAKVLKVLGKAITRKSTVTLEDLHIDANKIIEEFEGGIGVIPRLLKKALNITGFTAIDRIGKETLVNAKLLEFVEQAKKSDIVLKDTLTRMFGSEDNAEQVIHDLIHGNKTDDILFLLWNELSDKQPITKLEVPEYYLTSNVGKVFYSLKTYQLKLLDIYRNDIWQEIRFGDKGKGYRKLITLTTALMLLGAGADEAKDFILGRETSFSDLLINNLLKIGGFSKYTIFQTRKEGLGRGFVSQFAPPFGILDTGTQDIDELIRKGELEKGARFTQHIPVIGKMYYWWLGRGSELKKEQDKFKR